MKRPKVSVDRVKAATCYVDCPLAGNQTVAAVEWHNGEGVTLHLYDSKGTEQRMDIHSDALDAVRVVLRELKQE